MRTIILFVLISVVTFTSSGQANQTVQWQFTAEHLGNGETMLKISANIAPGWHLYSQFIAEGGPIPTRFTFENADGLDLIGTPEEKGKAFRFHDDMYEMEITWYSEKVDFSQKVSITESLSSIRGKVEYMTCNAHTCVPDAREFVITVPDQKKSHR